MNRKLTALALSGVLLCSAGVPALAAEEVPPASQAVEDTEMKDERSLPDSVLYYGEVKEVLTGEDGAVTGLHMDSEQWGEYVMKISHRTFWIDSGARTASSPAGLAAGERLYVYHSPVSTRSMPPQSEAYAVVRHIPQDAGCARYCEAEAVEERDGTLQITTENGGLYLYADQETTLSTYTGGPAGGLSEIKAGSYIMAWYDFVALSYPGQAHPRHIMLLDREAGSQLLTRSALISLLHAEQGSPVVNYLMDYSDVDQSAPYAEAIRWAASERIVSGYGGGLAGPGDAVTREQMVTIFWRWSGSPVLMDYPGLAGCSDAGDISLFAQPALAWAHQKGLLPAGGRLGPQDTVTPAEAEAMLTALRGEREPLR